MKTLKVVPIWLIVIYLVINSFYDLNSLTRWLMLGFILAFTLIVVYFKFKEDKAKKKSDKIGGKLLIISAFITVVFIFFCYF